MVFTGVLGDFTGEVSSCENNGGRCVPKKDGCIDFYGEKKNPLSGITCPNSDQNDEQVCCNKAILKMKLGDGEICLEDGDCETGSCGCRDTFTVMKGGPNDGKCGKSGTDGTDMFDGFPRCV